MQLKLFNSEVMIKYTKLKNLCYSSLCWTLPFAWKVSVIKSSELVILGGVHRMNKFLMAGIVAAMAAATSVATASPLVTAKMCRWTADITDISTNWKEWVISKTCRQAPDLTAVWIWQNGSWKHSIKHRRNQCQAI